MRTRWMTVMVVVGSLSLGLAACGGDDDGGEVATTTTAPEDKVSTGAEVAAGLREVSAMAADIAAAEDPHDDDVDAMYERWFEFEGTVRATDRDRYLAMEDQLAAIKGGVADGDEARVDTAAAELATVVEAYLDAHGETTGTTVAAGKRPPVDADLYDYRIELSDDTVGPGVTTFDLHNETAQVHEFVVVKTDLDPKDLPVDGDGNVDEAGEGITFVDEVEDIEAGARPSLNVDLETGSYVLLCNLPGHYDKGMWSRFEVA